MIQLYIVNKKKIVMKKNNIMRARLPNDVQALTLSLRKSENEIPQSNTTHFGSHAVSGVTGSAPMLEEWDTLVATQSDSLDKDVNPTF